MQLSTSTIFIIQQPCFREGLTFKYHANKPEGYTFICEASDLSHIDDESYDFIMSSHVIEHIANPLKTISEWKRVVRIGGVILFVCPHKDGTYDHKRPITPLAHLIEDYIKGVDENDLTHQSEVLKLHDLSRDTNSYDQVLAVSTKNFEYRWLHHHVFVSESWITILDYLNLEVACIGAWLPFNIIAVGKKVDETPENLERLHASNMRLLAVNARWRLTSPFQLDKSCL